MSNLRMGLCGKLVKSIGWSAVTYQVDNIVIRSLNNWGLVDHVYSTLIAFTLE